jgi:outer membrane protein assembly factor BamD (BamD/ComL family)
LLIPELRLESLLSPEYDRQALVQARVELIDWLQTFPNDAAAAQARKDLVDCNLRLYENDMIVSKFYAEVASPWGARFHALRAIDEAREAGDAAREAQAREWLQGLPPAPAGARTPEEVRAAEAAAIGADGGTP